MKFAIPKCPDCGEPPVYIVEELTASALLNEPKEDGTQDYSGTTKMHWDTQTPMKVPWKVGHMENPLESLHLVGCNNRHEWETKMES